VCLIEDSGDVKGTLASIQGAVTFDVAGCSVDEMGHGDARVGVVCIVVNDGRCVDGAVCAEREKTLIPVYMAGKGVRARP
jgi:hypothetical protein